MEENSIYFIGFTQQIYFVRLFESAGLRNYMVFSVYDCENLIGEIIFQVKSQTFEKRLVSTRDPLLLNKM